MSKKLIFLTEIFLKKLSFFKKTIITSLRFLKVQNEWFVHCDLSFFLKTTPLFLEKTKNKTKQKRSFFFYYFEKSNNPRENEYNESLGSRMI